MPTLAALAIAGNGQAQDGDDQDSLFGSPPSSPVIGRPAHASGSTTPSGPGEPHTMSDVPMSPRQNVGTIALPGSHMSCSELPEGLLVSHQAQTQHTSYENATSSGSGAAATSNGVPHAPSVPTQTVWSSSTSVGRPGSYYRRDYNHQEPPGTTSGPSSESVFSVSGARTFAVKDGDCSQHKSKTSARRGTKSTSHSTPQPSPPIEIPEPGTTLPPNFLRNQQALLGHAGLVSGIRGPSLYPVRQKRSQTPRNTGRRKAVRGSTSTDPIVVEDVEETAPRTTAQSTARPTLQVAQQAAPQSTLQAEYQGSHNTTTKGKGKEKAPPTGDGLTSEDVVASLIKEKNIFPVLQNLVKLLGGSASSTEEPTGSPGPDCSPTPPPPSTTSNEPLPVPFARPYGVFRDSSQSSEAQSEARPSKRRRLIAVPAGAADWDVPYPFSDGEGPEAYREGWEKKRAVRLVGELVKLVQGATERVVTKKRVQVEKGTKNRRSRTASSTRSSSQRPETRPETSNQNVVSTETADASMTYDRMTISSPSTLSPVPPPDPLFDEMLQSLLNTMPQPTNQPVISSSGAGSSSLDSSSRATSAIPEFDQTELEAWLSQLGTLPLTGADNDAVSNILTDNLHANTPVEGAPMDVDVDEQPTQLTEQQSTGSSVLGTVISMSNGLELPAMDTSQSFQFPQLNTIVPDTAIDPALLALSLPSASWNPSSSQPLLDPRLWPLNTDVLPGCGPPPDAQVPSVPSLAHSPISSAGSFPEALTPRLSTEPEPHVQIFGQDKVGIGKTQAPTGEHMEVEASTPSTTQGLGGKKGGKQLVKAKPPKTKTTQKSTPKAAMSSRLQYYPPDKRQEIFQRAWDRRDELKAEIERAKIELWEVSVEGGVLGVLGKSK